MIRFRFFTCARDVGGVPDDGTSFAGVVDPVPIVVFLPRVVRKVGMVFVVRNSITVQVVGVLALTPEIENEARVTWNRLSRSPVACLRCAFSTLALTRILLKRPLLLRWQSVTLLFVRADVAEPSLPLVSPKNLHPLWQRSRCDGKI